MTILVFFFFFGRTRDPSPLKFDDSLHLNIIKEALLRAIHDIDATFTKVYAYSGCEYTSQLQFLD